MQIGCNVGTLHNSYRMKATRFFFSFCIFIIRELGPICAGCQNDLLMALATVRILLMIGLCL
jgi:hypothetical protein